MSELNKYIFNEPKFHVPSTLIYIDKRGKEKVVPTLTATGNLTTRNKTKSIQIIPDDDKFVIDLSSLKKYEPKEIIKKEIIKKEIKEEPKEEIKKESKEESEYFKKQMEETLKYNQAVNKIRNDLDNKILFSGDNSKLNYKNKGAVLLKIFRVINMFEKGIKLPIKTEEERNFSQTILDAISGFDFYPTPSRISELLSKKIIDDYRNDNSRGFKVMDMCAGLGALSYDLISQLRNNEMVILSELNQFFTEELKELKSPNIVINTENILESGDKYYNKCIDVIISNPPYTYSGREYLTPNEEKYLLKWEQENLNHKKYNMNDLPNKIKELVIKRQRGRETKNSLFYFHFLIKALDILENQHTSTEKTLYFICPYTWFRNTSGDNLKPSDKGDLCTIDIPKATLKRIYKDLDLENKYNEDEDLFVQCKFLELIDDFSTYRNGKPVKMNLRVGLFEIIPYNNQPAYIIN